MGLLKSWFSKAKVLICIILAAGLAFLFCLQNSLGDYSQEVKSYTVSIKNEKNKLSGGAEVRITGLSVSGKQLDLSDPESYSEYFDVDGIGQYIDGMLVFYPYNSDISFDVNIPFGKTLTIDWLKHPWSGIVNISDGETIEKLDLYSEDSETLSYDLCYTSVDFDKMLQRSPINAAEYLLSLLVCLICIWAVSLVIWAINNSKFKFYLIPVIIIPLFILGVNTLYFITFVSNWLTFGVVVLTLVYLCFRTRHVLTNNIENAYAVFIAVFGTAILLLLPIGHVPDEFSHQAKTYAIAEGYDNVDELNYIHFPSTEQQLLEHYATDVISVGISYSPVETIEFLKAEPVSFDDHSATWPIYNIMALCDISYYPATVPVLLGRIIPLTAAMIFLMGRLINLIIGAMLFYTAIRITPSYKRIFTLVALFPITVQQTAAVNQDWITNALVFMLLAEVFSVAFDDGMNRITKRKLVLIPIIALILPFTKSGYWIAVLLVLILPASKFSSKKVRNLYCYGLIAATLITFVIQFMYSSTISAAFVDPSKYTFSDILKDPGNFILSCYNIFMERGLFDGLDGLLTGFGWSTKWATGIIRTLMFLSASQLILGDVEEKHSVSIRQRLILAAVALIITGMIYAALYTWTYIGQTSIGGLQCRYFIPVNLLAYIAVSNKKLNISVKNPNKLYLAFSAIVLTVGIYQIAFGFYV